MDPRDEPEIELLNNIDDLDVQLLERRLEMVGGLYTCAVDVDYPPTPPTQP